MVIIYPHEEYREIKIDESLKFRYAISNTGKLISFTNQFHDGRILNGCLIGGYRIFRYKAYKDGKVLSKHFLFYKLVAEYFLPKTSDDQTYILHLNFDKADDRADNLKWATKADMVAHFMTNPRVILAIKRMKEHKCKGNSKLTAIKVTFIKRMLKSKKTRKRMIGKQFGVSETQIKRIQIGENWADIKG
jgi:hypothetical protein